MLYPVRDRSLARFMRETFIKAKQFSVDRLRVELLPAQALQDLLSKHHERPAVDMRRALYCHAPEKGSAILYLYLCCIFVYLYLLPHA
jgi:hypothetical protein